MNSPFVMMCSKCRQVVSDSNQFLSAVPELDALVLDAVVGVRISEQTALEGAAVFSKLSCSSCKAELGRIYQAAPAMQSVVHTQEKPRYTLYRCALGSYVLGSAKTQHDALQPSLDALQGSAPKEVPAVSQESFSKCSPATDEVRMQLSQLMRVVLGLDQRLRFIEQL